MKPIKIKKLTDSLLITWDNNKETELSNLKLRKYCPCAVCHEERAKQSETYIPIFLKDQITIKELKIMGAYALNIIWNDGHSTGIYEFDILLRLSDFPDTSGTHNSRYNTHE